MAIDGAGTLSPQKLAKMLERGECDLVDVREGLEWVCGRLRQARHIPLGELGQRMNELDPEREVVVMCQSGGRSRKAAGLLRNGGFRRVREAAGGLQAWEVAGMEVEREEKAPWALERQVRIAAGLLVLLGLALSPVWPMAIALSWVVAAGLVFAAVTNSCGMGMILAKAPWNRVSTGNSEEAGSCDATG